MVLFLDILEELVRATNKADDVSIIEVLLVYENISDFFEGVDSVVSIQASLDSLFDQVRELRGLTEEEKIKLEEKKMREQELKAKIELEKKEVTVKQNEKQGELASSKAVEQTYAQELAEKQAKQDKAALDKKNKLKEKKNEKVKDSKKDKKKEDKPTKKNKATDKLKKKKKK